jgi:hypothetical protein
MIKRYFEILTLVIFVSITSYWGWTAFKLAEPKMFPVVDTFNILTIERAGDSLYIAGEMNKSRECRFISLAVYDTAQPKMRLLDVEFLDTPSNVQNRVEGFQAWGLWKITPNTRNILLVSTHECLTGSVETSLYDGAI